MEKIIHKTKATIFFILIIIVILTSYSLCQKEIFSKKDNCCIDCPTDAFKYESIFFDNQLFVVGETLANEKAERIKEKIKGGIIPHHLLAGQFISDFFKRVPLNTKLIILIGPNHEENGLADIISSWNNWETPFGIVETDKCIINDLNKKNIFTIDETTMRTEHSIGAIMPYIKKYLPQAKIVPIILKQKTEDIKLEEIAQELNKLIKEDNVLLVASIDFSHYLAPIEAEKKDKETKKAIERMDYSTISSFNNDHLDSPSSLILLLKTFEIYEKAIMKIVDNSNSGEILKQKNINETTSYFEIIFAEK